jgi:AcrR family transcriptional regulator
MRDGRAAATGRGDRWFAAEQPAMIRSEDGPERGEAPSEVRLPTSERLLDIAAALFWSKGYAATTTREIAAVLGIRKASLYHHVRRKEDLLYDICVASLEHIHQAVESAVTAVDDPLERVPALIRAHVLAMLVHQDMHSTMLTELRALTAQRRAKIVRLRDGYERFVRGILANAQQAGLLRADVPAKYLCLSLLDQLNWAIFWFHREGELSAEALADVLTTIYMNGVAPSPSSH